MSVGVYGCAGNGCIYWNTWYGWCNYGEITGRSRLVVGGPIGPDGKCKLYKPGKKVKLDNRITFGRNTNYIYQKIKDYYEKGLTDKEIARIAGVSKNTVHKWRVSKGLKSNFFLKKNSKDC